MSPAVPPVDGPSPLRWFTAGLFAAVGPDQWQRPGTRSNGSQFTVATLAVYFLHDLEHHLHDVGG